MKTIKTLIKNFTDEAKKQGILLWYSNEYGVDTDICDWMPNAKIVEGTQNGNITMLEKNTTEKEMLETALKLPLSQAIAMEKKPGAYDTFDMDDVKEGRVECVVGDPTDSLEKEFDEEYDGCCLGATQGASDANKKDLKVFISQVRQKAVKETLQFIALKEGWEETEEIYAKELGIDLSE